MFARRLPPALSVRTLRALRLPLPVLVRPTGTRFFQTTPVWAKIVPFHLADIGEGITECELIQWYASSVPQFSNA
jgi:2-oxoisovalerate dehydrogenase E2 component (dihydrolipoyl transacylase)